MAHCPNCGTDIESLIAPFREAAERDFARRVHHAAYKRQRYATDPEYRERHKATERRYRAKKGQEGDDLRQPPRPGMPWPD